MTPEMLTTLTEQVAELVQTYSNNYPQFQRATYNETQVRVDFVNRFFKLLGWDVDNERGLPQHLREVTHEATVVVEEDGVHRNKKPDYSFKVGTEVLYFLETKKPAVNLTIDAAPAFQLRRYGWSGNLKVSVLTNFTDLYIYDCSVRPREGDDIGIAMITSQESIFYIQAILNHWLMELLVKSRASTFRGDYYSHGKQFIATLPIYKIDFENPTEVARHQRIVEMVQNIMQLKEQLASAPNAARCTVLEHSITAINAELNIAIDELYQVESQEVEEQV